jgi:hypothetical protein
MKNLLIALAAVAVFAAGMGVAGVRLAQGQQADHRITICHDVQGNGNTGNGYDIITVDKDAIVNKDGQIVPNGHGTHSGDGIPAFPAGSQGNKEWGAFGGQNGNIDPANNCAETPTTTTTTTTETTTTTTTPPPPPPTTTETTTTETTETETTTTTEEGTTETTPPSPPPPKPKPPKKAPPKPKPPKQTPPMPKPCPVGQPTTKPCAVQGNG